MRHLETVKRAVMFTDIKDFTLKNSLLTQKQIRAFLNVQDDLLFPIIRKNHGKIVKTIGDSFMIIFDNVDDAIKGAIEIQKSLEEYNESVNFNLHKLELRITINYGEIQKEETILGEDYLGDVVNIASRLQFSVDGERIYTTKEVINKINNKNINYIFLGKTSLRGVLHEVEVYEILYHDIDIKSFQEGKNFRKNYKGILLTEILREKINSVKNMVLEFSLITAIAGMVNIKFIGIFIQLPFHLFLLKKIADKYGIKYLTKKELNSIIFVTFVSLIGLFLINAINKYLFFTNLNGYSGFITFVLNFVLCFSIGTYLNEYFCIKSQKIENTNKDLKKMLYKIPKKKKNKDN